MKREVFGKAKRNVFSVFAVLLGISLLLGGCGSDSYDTPTTISNAPITGAATSALIEPATLKAWIDQGLVNADSSFNEKVVILEYNGSGDRIPGAFRVGAGELRATRLDGLAPAGSLVATGDQMDAVIQRLGIDANTTIVFVTSAAMYNETRAYWTFRYWGFPQERLKVLNGGYAAWQADSYTLTAEEPTAVPSTYSVKDLGTLNSDLRVSISELLAKLGSAEVNGTDYLTMDARTTLTGTSSGYYGNVATGSLITGFVVFEGRPAGGVAVSQGSLFGADGKYKPVTDTDADATNDLTSIFEAAGWTPGLPVITYCTSGFSCTPIYFALEAILGSPVQVFDGSWSTAGQYAALATDADNDGYDDVTGAGLPIGSAWDLSQYVVTGDYLAPTLAPGYNVNNGKTWADIYKTPFSSDLESWYAPGSAETNQVESTDDSYISSGSTTAPPTSVDGGGSVGC